MAYQALYRKFRPTTFDHVIGQNHIVRTLKNQMTSGRVSHAYLFCGTRGTGKTSTAKIFARAINCLDSQYGEPCNECEMCMAIAEGRSMNVVEIDAASNNGVDNIREIREEVKYPPTQGRYKVYIIDEVHMLSTGAFNALLKTLEEPPQHVIFILATTDPQKVPATIHSRCQRFDFRRISSSDIVNTLKLYLNEEKVVVEDKALHYIAQLADGSMRDSLSILDQCMAFYFNEIITLEKVLDIVGSVDNSIMFKMTNAIVKKDAAQAMDLIEDMVMQGRDVGQFVTELTVHMRNLLVTSTIDDPYSVLDISQESIDQLKEQCKMITAEETIYLIKVFSELSSNLKYAINERILLEVALIKLCSPDTYKSYDGLAARISGIEKEIKNGVVMAVSESMDSVTQKKVQQNNKPKPKPKALPEDIKEAIDIWLELKSEFDMSTKGLLTAVDLGYMENDCLSLICSNETVEGIIKNKIEKIKEVLTNRINKDFELRTITKSEYNNWRASMYGAEETKDEDLEFENLMQGYFPEADIE